MLCCAAQSLTVSDLGRMQQRQVQRDEAHPRGGAPRFDPLEDLLVVGGEACRRVVGVWETHVCGREGKGTKIVWECYVLCQRSGAV